MLRAALTVGLLSLSSSPEARHLPPGLQAARILDGSARLEVVPGKPDAHLTLLEPGVYFTADGYAAVEVATLQLQANLKAVEARVRDYERQALMPCPTVEPAPSIGGWSTRHLLIAGVVGLAAGALGAVVLHGMAGGGR